MNTENKKEDEIITPEVVETETEVTEAAKKEGKVDFQKIIKAKDEEIEALKKIIKTQDKQLEKTATAHTDDSKKEKIRQAGLVPIVVGGVLKGSCMSHPNGIALENLTKEQIEELDELGTVFHVVK
jgi:hypothetical protein